MAAQDNVSVAQRYVLHILPSDIARGAQTYARGLREALDGPEFRHRTLALFGAAGTTLRPDLTLGVDSGVVRRAGVDLRAVRRLRARLREDPPTIVVAHGGEPLKYAVLAGVPDERLVYYKIGVGGTRLSGPKGFVHARLLRHPRVVAAVSNDAADEVRALGVAPDRVVVIPNGRDPSRYGPHLPAADAAVRLVYVGHLTASKRPERFIDVVASVRKAGYAVDATIAGDGPLLDSVRASGRLANVDVRGRVDDVPALLAASDLFVFTSVADGEGMPGVLIEAGLAGLPTVTTRVPGAADVIDDSHTGYVVPIDDFDALAKSTVMLVEQPALRTRFGDAARQRCTEHFSMAASFERWHALLASMPPVACASST
jgi:glycosyltransferase involved in cell wall biosynthesis